MYVCIATTHIGQHVLIETNRTLKVFGKNYLISKQQAKR